MMRRGGRKDGGRRGENQEARGRSTRGAETSCGKVTKMTKEKGRCVINKRGRWRGRGGGEHMHSLGGHFE